jgi:hypothetical protein
VNLFENDLTQIIIDNYALSVGYIQDTTGFTIDTLNAGIKNTFNLSLNNISRASLINPWQTNAIHQETSLYVNDSRVYVCLYSPGTVSVYPPTGNTKTNMIMDDNYVWRYITDVDHIVDGNYVAIKPQDEIIKKGSVASIKIIKNSGSQITNYNNHFYLNNSYLSGQNLNYVVEVNQNTQVISDILVQDGGSSYKNSDIFVMTDTAHADADNINIVTEIVNGSVNLVSYTNGQNYSYLDIIIIGDGTGASAQFTNVAGVLTSLTITGGSNYTWAKAIVVNSENYIIGKVDIEPFNGYNADQSRVVGPNKYIINVSFNSTDMLNFYGLHKNLNNSNKYILFDNLYIVPEFTPLQNETIKLKLIVG